MDFDEKSDHYGLLYEKREPYVSDRKDLMLPTRFDVTASICCCMISSIALRNLSLCDCSWQLLSSY